MDFFKIATFKINNMEKLWIRNITLVLQFHFIQSIFFNGIAHDILRRYNRPEL